MPTSHEQFIFTVGECAYGLNCGLSHIEHVVFRCDMVL